MTTRDDLIRDEEFVRHAYQDSRGIWTCGVGFNIDKDHGGSIPDEIINIWLDLLIKRASGELDTALPWWRGRPDWVQSGMLQMCYQLGIGGLQGFPKMLAATHAGDYATARQEGANSDWARTQTPGRAARVIALFTDTAPDGWK